MPRLNIKQTFGTYSYFEEELQKFQKEENFRFKLVRSKTLEASTLKGPFPDGLKYKELYYHFKGFYADSE